jgi:hypothetical protein
MIPAIAKYRMRMHIITTRVHGWLDYVFAVILITSPYTMDYFSDPTATSVSMGIGSIIILYSLLTKYEPGVIKIIPMNIHLGLDLLGAIVLGSSPWVFGFSEYIWRPHVFFAAFEIIVILCSSTRTPGWRHREKQKRMENE